MKCNTTINVHKHDENNIQFGRIANATKINHSSNEVDIIHNIHDDIKLKFWENNLLP